MSAGPDGAARPCILVVDDTPDNLALMNGLLKDRYRVRMANGGTEQSAELMVGQHIGNVGMTGNVTSPQLHFEIRQGKQPVDPEKQIAGGATPTASRATAMRIGAIR